MSSPRHSGSPRQVFWSSFPRQEEPKSKAKREWPGPYFEPAYDLWRLRPRKTETTEATEPPLNQPSGAQIPLSQSTGTEPLTVQISGTEPLTVQTTGTEPLTAETSDTEPSHIQPSGIQTQISPLSGEQPTKTASPVKAPSAPMPSFTSQGPGTSRIKSPIRGETLNTPTKTTQVGERTKAREAKIAEIVRQQRNGTWDGIPTGWHVVVDSCGHERIAQNKTAVDKEAIKSKDARKPEEVTALQHLAAPRQIRTSRAVRTKD